MKVICYYFPDSRENSPRLVPVRLPPAPPLKGKRNSAPANQNSDEIKNQSQSAVYSSNISGIRDTRPNYDSNFSNSSCQTSKTNDPSRYQVFDNSIHGTKQNYDRDIYKSLNSNIIEENFDAYPSSIYANSPNCDKIYQTASYYDEPPVDDEFVDLEKGEHNFQNQISTTYANLEQFESNRINYNNFNPSNFNASRVPVNMNESRCSKESNESRYSKESNESSNTNKSVYSKESNESSDNNKSLYPKECENFTESRYSEESPIPNEFRYSKKCNESSNPNDSLHSKESSIPNKSWYSEESPTSNEARSRFMYSKNINLDSESCMAKVPTESHSTSKSQIPNESHSHNYDSKLQYSSEKSYKKPIESRIESLDAKISQMWLANVGAVESIPAGGNASHLKHLSSTTNSNICNNSKYNSSNSSVSVTRDAISINTITDTNSTTCTDASASITPNYNLDSNVNDSEYSHPVESCQSSSKEQSYRSPKHSSAFIKELEKNLGKVQANANTYRETITSEAILPATSESFEQSSSSRKPESNTERQSASSVSNNSSSLTASKKIEPSTPSLSLTSATLQTSPFSDLDVESTKRNLGLSSNVDTRKYFTKTTAHIKPFIRTPVNVDDRLDNSSSGLQQTNVASQDYVNRQHYAVDMNDFQMSNNFLERSQSNNVISNQSSNLQYSETIYSSERLNLGPYIDQGGHNGNNSSNFNQPNPFSMNSNLDRINAHGPIPGPQHIPSNNRSGLQSGDDFLDMITGGLIGQMSISNDSSSHRPVLTPQEMAEFESHSNASNLSASSMASAEPAVNRSPSYQSQNNPTGSLQSQNRAGNFNSQNQAGSFQSQNNPSGIFPSQNHPMVNLSAQNNSTGSLQSQNPNLTGNFHSQNNSTGSFQPQSNSNMAANLNTAAAAFPSQNISTGIFPSQNNPTVNLPPARNNSSDSLQSQINSNNMVGNAISFQPQNNPAGCFPPSHNNTGNFAPQNPAFPIPPEELSLMQRIQYEHQIR